MQLLELMRILIISFLQEKSRCLEIYIGVPDLGYMLPADYNEVARWDMSTLLRVLKEAKVNSDFCMCPWCIVYFDRKLSTSGKRCSKCLYGIRHKICSDNRSTYTQIRNYLGDVGGTGKAVSSVRGMEQIYNIFRKNANRIIRGIERLHFPQVEKELTYEGFKEIIRVIPPPKRYEGREFMKRK